VNAKTVHAAMRRVLPAALVLGCAGAGGSAQAEASPAFPELFTVAADPPIAAPQNTPEIAAIAGPTDGAADAGSTAYSPTPPAGESWTSGWTFSVTPYAWITGLNGNLGVVNAVPPVSVHLTPWELIDALHFTVMATVEADKDRFIVASDNLYAFNGFSKHITIHDADFVKASVNPVMVISTNDVGYRFVDGPMTVDILAGFRFYHVKPAISLSGPIRSFQGDQVENWAAPVVGLRFKGPLSEKWSYSLWGDVGGLTADTTFTGQIFGSAQYAFARNWTAVVGWRYMDTNYHNGQGFVFDVALNGPVLGATYRF
jgi:hypothetical protein